MWLVILFTLASRLGIFFWVRRNNPAGIWAADAIAYYRMAAHALHHGWAALTRLPPTFHDAYRPQGYPLIIAGLFSLFGQQPLGVILTQILASTGVVFITYQLGREAFGHRVGLVGASLLALDAASIRGSEVLLSETFFTLLLVLALWCLVKALTAPGRKRYDILAGAALAVATHIRPISYYLIPLIALALLILPVPPDALASSGRRWLAITRDSCLRAAVFLIFPLLLVGGWQVWRFRETGHLGFSGIEGVNMLFYRGAGTLAIAEHRSFSDVTSQLGFRRDCPKPFAGYLARHPKAGTLTGAALSDRWMHEGLGIVGRHPGAALLLALRSIGQMMSEPGSYNLAVLLGLESDSDAPNLVNLLQHGAGGFLAALWNRFRALALLSTWGYCWLLLLYAGTVMWFVRRGTGRLPSRRVPPGVSPRSATVLLVGVMVYFIIISAGPEAGAKFRVPFAPILMLLAAAGWEPILFHSGRS